MEIPIYHNQYPKIFENVLVTFTTRNDTHIEADLIDYNMKGMMSYNDATKKKKVYSWSKLVPLGKPMVARVEQVFVESNYVQLSIAYFYNNKANEEEINKALMKPFADNKVTITIIKKLTYENKLDFNEFWKNIIYKLDEIRKEYDPPDSLYEALNNNIDKVNELIRINYENHETIINTLHNLLNNKINKIETKFGLISNNGIQKTKDLLICICTDSKWQYTLKYHTAPYYILESSSETSTAADHESFINLLQSKCSEYNVFTKIDYTAKVI
uniref:S1 motif domain-containing protein n=1 Tax=viral metagenome TaxID=1070528 RepID=A0A6C0DAZ4_9ZZZZ